MQIHTSSFESAGSSGGGYPYSPGPPGYPYTSGGGGSGNISGNNHFNYYAPWPAQPPPPVLVECTSIIHPEDVLSGRGGATNSHSGNRAFRSLVKEYQERYLLAKKRDKPAVASIVVGLIREKGGRFLTRADTSALGQVLWTDIGDERAREKTCQALREGAPELRRRKDPVSIGEDQRDHANRNDSLKDMEATLSSPSSVDCTLSERDPRQVSTKPNKTRWTNEEESDFEDARGGSRTDGPILIRPLSRLVPQRGVLEPIPLDQLSAEDRDLYLRDFLPPCPPIRKRRRSKLQNGLPFDGSVEYEERFSWPAVSV
jgi:hypothetical protein